MQWQVANQSSQAAAGNWQDSVYLSPTPALESASTLLGAVVHDGGLAADASYSAGLTAAVPALSPAITTSSWQVDSLYQVLDTNRANNTLAANTGQLDVTLPALTLGTTANGAFSTAGQHDYYQVNVPAGGSLVVSLVSSASSGATALYVSQGTQPSPYDYQEGADAANQPNQTAIVPQVLTAGTYFILAEGVSGPAATSAYMLTASQVAALTVPRISSYSGGNAGNVTVDIDGTNFGPSATASLTLGAATINASAIDFVERQPDVRHLQRQRRGRRQLQPASPARGHVGDGANGVPGGSRQAGIPANDTQPPRVFLAPGEPLASSSPTRTRPTTTWWRRWLTIASPNSYVFFSTPDEPNDYTQSVQVLAVAPSGPAGILRPGQSGQLTLALADDIVAASQTPTQVSEDSADSASVAEITPFPVGLIRIAAGQTIDWAVGGGVAATPQHAECRLECHLQRPAGHSRQHDRFLQRRPGPGRDLPWRPRRNHGPGQRRWRLWSFLVAQADADFPATTLTSAIDASLVDPRQRVSGHRPHFRVVH